MTFPLTDRPLRIGVTGLNARPDNPGPGLAVARCLKASDRFQSWVVGFGYDALDAGLYLDDYCDAGYLLPYPSAGEEALIERLQQIQKNEQLDILIPCLDAELMSFIRIRPELNDMGIRTLLPNRDQLRMCNKDRLGELAEMAGIASPRSQNITHASFFETCHEQGWYYPLVVKGLFYDAEVVQTAAQGVAAFHRIAASWGLPIVVQKYISDMEEINLTAIGDGQGRILAPVMMAKRAITDKGKAWAGMSITDERLLEIAHTIVQTVRWPGPLEVEVMRRSDGEYLLVEINPRFPAWIYLSEGVGRNLPAILAALIAGHKPADFPPPQAGVLFIRHALEEIVPLKAFESMIISGGWTANDGKRSE